MAVIVDIFKLKKCDHEKINMVFVLKKYLHFNLNLEKKNLKKQTNKNKN